jgi:hypothetical protein
MEKVGQHPVNNGQKWITLAIIYLALIAFHGYRFGDEDMTETLSYALYLRDHTLYPKDLYIQAVGPYFLNERYFFARLLSLFSKHLDWASYMMHLMTSIMLLSGLWELSSRFLKTHIYKLIFLLITLFVSYNLNLGGNEIWYNYFVPSHLAKSIGIWGIVFWLRGKQLQAYIIVALATFAQPVVGAQLALLFLIIDLYKPKLKILLMLRGPLVYGLTAGIWITAVFFSHLIGDQSISDREFYDIMETRLAHHFFPSYYPFRAWIMLIPLFIVATLIWKKYDQKLLHFFLWSLTGMIFYYLGIEVLEIPGLLSVQWFKITVWLKPLAILAILMVIETMVSIDTTRFIGNGLLLSILVASIIQISGIFRVVDEKPRHFPGTNYYTADMELALTLRDKVPSDACIIVPPDVTGIRYFSRRSLYIDYKSNIHSKSYLAEAARRRKQLYGQDLQQRQSRSDVMLESKNYYQKLQESDFEQYKIAGVGYVITTVEQKLDFAVITSNSLFTLYKM